MTTTVLIVDDHAGFRGFARRLVEAAGYTVIGEAEDGASARDLVSSLKPQAVLLDIVLPDESGFDVAEALGSAEVGGADAGDPRAVAPSIVLTSSKSADDLGPRLEASGLRFVSKSDLTVAALREALG